MFKSQSLFSRTLEKKKSLCMGVGCVCIGTQCGGIDVGSSGVAERSSGYCFGFQLQDRGPISKGVCVCVRELRPSKNGQPCKLTHIVPRRATLRYIAQLMSLFEAETLLSLLRQEVKRIVSISGIVGKHQRSTPKRLLVATHRPVGAPVWTKNPTFRQL